MRPDLEQIKSEDCGDLERLWYGESTMSGSRWRCAMGKVLKLALILGGIAFAGLVTLSISAASTYEELDRLFSQGDLRKVIHLADAALRKNPTNIDALYFLGVAYWRLNQHEEGLKFLRQFEKLHDQLELKRKQDETKGSSADLLLVDARYFPGYFLLDEYYVKNSDFSKAERNLRRAKSRYNEDRMFNFYMGITSLELKKYEESRKYFKKMMVLDPNEPSSVYNIASSYAREGKSSEAIEWLRKAIAQHPPYKKEAASDKDFSSLKNSEEFQQLISK
jgi:tetratricopeptide (TPR) repeat protein